MCVCLEQELAQVSDTSTSLTEMERDVFGDLNQVYAQNLARARAAKFDGSAWLVPDAATGPRSALRLQDPLDPKVTPIRHSSLPPIYSARRRCIHLEQFL